MTMHRDTTEWLRDTLERSQGRGLYETEETGGGCFAVVRKSRLSTRVYIDLGVYEGFFVYEYEGDAWENAGDHDHEWRFNSLADLLRDEPI